MSNYNDVTDFWFDELQPKDWFVKNPEIDSKIKNRFLDLHHKASKCELASWRSEPLGRLAEIIVLDQFSRNIYRNSPQAFTQDSIALVLSQVAVEQCSQNHLNSSQKSFLYMPFMHSESAAIHLEAVKLFSEKDLEGVLAFEVKHKKIIDRFGRYPHRNTALGRESTPEEIEFLNEPNSSF